MKSAHPGEDRLRAALTRAKRIITAAPPDPDPAAPSPATEWEHATDRRLRAIEVQLANQNRLLLLTCIGIVADVLLKVAA